MTEILSLLMEQGDWSVLVRPDIGASIARLTWRGQDILRPAPDTATSPLEMGSFPLLPYANRIARGRFRFAERDIVLTSDPVAEPHALHGVGWRRPWRVIRSDLHRVDLGLAAAPSQDWPWRWAASCALLLGSEGLTLTLSITNEDSAPMPAGLGLHPYFAVRPETVLTADAEAVWLNGPDDIPAQKGATSSAVDWSQGALVSSAPFVDNAYCGWSGRARLADKGHTVRVTASPNARWMQVYAPRGEDYICIEPMTHRPDAVNAPDTEDAGLITLMPGQSLAMSMHITAEPTSPLP